MTRGTSESIFSRSLVDAAVPPRDPNEDEDEEDEADADHDDDRLVVFVGDSSSSESG
jgi:hypothetical protein